jgi:hypothetical protein
MLLLTLFLTHLSFRWTLPLNGYYIIEDDHLERLEK